MKPVRWFTFRGVDGAEWTVYLTPHRIGAGLGRRDGIVGAGPGKVIAGLTDRDKRRIDVDPSWPDFETTTVHELMHACMWGCGFDDESEESIADLAMRIQIVFGSLGFRLPPVPKQFARLRSAARRKYRRT